MEFGNDKQIKFLLPAIEIQKTLKKKLTLMMKSRQKEDFSEEFFYWQRGISFY